LTAVTRAPEVEGLALEKLDVLDALAGRRLERAVLERQPLAVAQRGVQVALRHAHDPNASSWV